MFIYFRKICFFVLILNCIVFGEENIKSKVDFLDSIFTKKNKKNKELFVELNDSSLFINRKHMNILKINFKNGFVYYDDFFILKDVQTIEYFNSLHDCIFCLSCCDAEYIKSKNLVKLSGNIVITVNDRKMKVMLDSLFIDIDKKKIYSYSEINIKSDDKVISGRGFYGDLDLTNYKIYDFGANINLKSDLNIF